MQHIIENLLDITRQHMGIETTTPGDAKSTQGDESKKNMIAGDSLLPTVYAGATV